MLAHVRSIFIFAVDHASGSRCCPQQSVPVDVLLADSIPDAMSHKRVYRGLAVPVRAQCLSQKHGQRFGR